MRKRRRKHRRYNNHIWLYSVLASICLLTMGVGYAILSAENNIQIDVTKTEAPIVLSGNLLTSLKQVGKSGEGRLEKITHSGVSQTDSKVSYRYRGKNPNNYVIFNNETWRIIGIVDGKVKLIRNESIGNNYWDDLNYAAMNLDNVVGNKISNNLYDDIVAIPMAPEIEGGIDSGADNEWLRAWLNKYLNGEYYNSLTSEAQAMIEESIWYLGGWDTNQIKTNEMYEKERGTTVYSGHSTKTTDKIALMYPSDYGYAAGESCSDSINLGNYNNTTCTSNNWLFKNDNIAYWTLTPDSYYSGVVFYVNSGGYVGNFSNDTADNHNSSIITSYHGVRPTVYLRSNVQITGGDGSQSKPYSLQIN